MKFAVSTYDSNDNQHKPLVAGTFGGDGVANINNHIVGPPLDLWNELPLNQWSAPGCPFYTSDGGLWFAYKDENTQWMKVASIAYDASYNLTVGATYNIYETWNGPDRLEADPHNPDHFAISYNNGGQQWILYFGISGTSIVDVTNNSIINNNDDAQGLTFKFDPINSTLGMMVCRRWSNNDQGEVTGISIDRATNTFSRAGGYSMQIYEQLRYPTLAYYNVASHTNQCAVVEIGGGWPPNPQQVTVYQVGGTASNINDVLPLGILQTGGANGTTQTVKLKGGLSTVHASLTPGQMYGINSSGDLVDAQDSSSIYTIGKAINTTSILQRGDV